MYNAINQQNSNIQCNNVSVIEHEIKRLNQENHQHENKAAELQTEISLNQSMINEMVKRKSELTKQ